MGNNNYCNAYHKENLPHSVDIVTGCWNWSMSLHKGGYGQIQFRGKHGRAHRASYIVFNGEIPDNTLVLHKCDNPSCINPEHLFLGTHQDNMDDKVSKGRSARGSKHGVSVLTEDSVKDIKCLLRTGDKTQEEIATLFNISRATICDINIERTWKHIK